MKRILCFFDYNCNTGFGTVTKNLVPQLKKIFGDKIQLDICAIGYMGQPYKMHGNTTVISAVKASAGAPQYDEFGRFAFLKALKNGNAHGKHYDGVFILQDIGVVRAIIEVMQSINVDKEQAGIKIPKTIFYVPVDCGLMPYFTEHIEFFDRIVTFTEYGRNELTFLRPDLADKISVIPHGNNPKDFYPIHDKQAVKDFRVKYFGKDNAEKFIITNVNRNQPRKDIPATILAFIKAKNEWPSHLPEPFLYLHMKAHDEKGYNLRTVIMQTDIYELEHIMFMPKHLEATGTDIPTLNKIYNASDLFITTTQGEGWGLSITEAMAAKVPVIAPEHTSITEIGGNGSRIWPLKKFSLTCNSIDNMIRQKCDIDEAADSIVAVANAGVENSAFSFNNQEKKQLAYDYVHELTWQKIASLFADTFRETYNIK